VIGPEPTAPGPFRVWLRLGWVVLALLPALAIGIPLQWLAIRFHLPWRRRLPWLFHRYAARVFRLRVRQEGRPSRQRPLLIVSSHVSWLDIVAVSAAAPVSFIAKVEVAGWPLFGLFAKLQRSVFVDRNRRSETRSVNAEIAERLRAGDPIVLFAEGTTGDGNRLLPFRSALIGAARDAVAAEGTDRVIVQPLSIVYVRRNGLPVTRVERPALAWYGDMELLPHLKETLCGGPIDVVLAWGTPVPFDSGTNRKTLTRTVEAEIRALAIYGRSGRRPDV